ncbi:hypothetical protein ABTM82_19565, partial [Acinetobacter baumannii]
MSNNKQEEQDIFSKVLLFNSEKVLFIGVLFFFISGIVCGSFPYFFGKKDAIFALSGICFFLLPLVGMLIIKKNF